MVSTVLVVDDHPIICDVLGTLILSVIATAAVSTATNLEDALALAGETDFDLVLLDLGLPGHRSIEALACFLRQFPKSRIVVVSAYDEPVTISCALRAGAVGYLPKTMPANTMAAALRLICEGGVFLPTQLVGNVGDNVVTERGSKPLGLTARQFEVLRLLEKRYANRQIAERLGITLGTVKQHVHDLLAALHVNSREQAIAEAERRGIRF